MWDAFLCNFAFVLNSGLALDGMLSRRPRPLLKTQLCFKAGSRSLLTLRCRGSVYSAYVATGTCKFYRIHRGLTRLIGDSGTSKSNVAVWGYPIPCSQSLLLARPNSGHEYFALCCGAYHVPVHMQGVNDRASSIGAGSRRLTFMGRLPVSLAGQCATSLIPAMLTILAQTARGDMSVVSGSS